MVFGDAVPQRFGSNRRGANGIRVENFPRIHYIGNSRRDSNIYDWITMWTWAVQRKDHLHVNVQQHCMGRTRKHKKCILNSVTDPDSNQLKVRFVNLWWYRLGFPMLTPYLRVQHHQHRENMLQEYARKFAELLDNQELSKQPFPTK